MIIGGGMAFTFKHFVDNVKVAILYHCEKENKTKLKLDGFYLFIIYYANQFKLTHFRLEIPC
jgi:hypothetical protein